MKVWLAGARGRLGAVLRERLERANVALVATGSETDIGDLETVTALAERERPALIVNAAAYTRVDDAETHAEAAFRANALGPGHLAVAAAAVGAELLHFSTEMVFDGRAERPYREDDPACPEGVYASTKHDGERRVFAATSDAWVVRTSWLFDDAGASFVASVREGLVNRDELSVVADQRGRATYAPDLADAALRLAGVLEPARHPATARPYGVYHFANDGVVTRHGLAEAVRERMLRAGSFVRARRIVPVSTAEYPLPAPRPAYGVLDTQKLERALGTRPRDFRAALDEYFAKRVH